MVLIDKTSGFLWKDHTKLLSNWKHMRDLVHAAEMAALDLLAHPEAEIEDIELVRRDLIEQRKRTIEVWKQIEHAFQGMHVKPLPPVFLQHRAERAKLKLADTPSASSTSDEWVKGTARSLRKETKP